MALGNGDSVGDIGVRGFVRIPVAGVDAIPALEPCLGNFVCAIFLGRYLNGAVKLWHVLSELSVVILADAMTSHMLNLVDFKVGDVCELAFDIEGVLDCAGLAHLVVAPLADLGHEVSQLSLFAEIDGEVLRNPCGNLLHHNGVVSDRPDQLVKRNLDFLGEIYHVISDDLSPDEPDESLSASLAEGSQFFKVGPRGGHVDSELGHVSICAPSSNTFDQVMAALVD